MLVYGDVERIESPHALRASIADALALAEGLPQGLARHAELSRAFIRASELAAGIADAEFAERGCDHRSGRQESGARFLYLTAQAMSRSWYRGMRDGSPLPAEIWDLLRLLDYPAPVRTKRAEGFALYALYPESYLEAARRSGLGPDTRVIGIRSIGAALGALVAAALQAKPALTVRPVGHPFAREVSASRELTASVVAGPPRPIAIVDEGPGISGSSFGGVADWLEANGVPRKRLHFFPSHRGDLGTKSNPVHRQRWAERPRHCLGFEETLLRAAQPSQRLDSWVASVIGRLDAPLEDISGGTWRKLARCEEAGWPPCDPLLERRKFLARAAGKTWLVKFAGLGDEGTRKLENARLLHAAGFTPAMAGLCHGFLVEHWIDGVPLSVAGFARQRLVEHLGRYLGCRARRLAAANGGASLVYLAHMARFNTGQALGTAAADGLEPLFRRAAGLEQRVRRVDTDNRLHAWEWLVAGDGRLIKTDALDHSACHDLVGCQDIAWDVAGAEVEHDLSLNEGACLRATISEVAGREVDPDLVALLKPCYLAFQIGLWTYAGMNSGGDDVGRARAAIDRYGRQLIALSALVAA